MCFEIFFDFLMKYFPPFLRGLDELDKPIDGDDEDIDSIDAARAKVHNRSKLPFTFIFLIYSLLSVQRRFAVYAALSKGQ